MSNVFVTGGTGCLGQRLIPALLNPGHQVQALVRAGSEGMSAPGCSAVVGNALDAGSYARQVPPFDTIVQLVGTPKPNPRKAQQFRDVDFKSGMAAVAASGFSMNRHRHSGRDRVGIPG
jgi:uncharacterized protein YbjT (DUF2867 family)